MSLVELSFPTASVATGTSVQGTVALRDAQGNTLSGRAITWSTSNASVASVSAGGLVTGVAPGSVVIAATSEGVTGTAPLNITPPPVASIQVSIPTPTVILGQSLQADATVRDPAGNVLQGRAITWSTSDASVATVTSSGVVTGVSLGTSSISASCEGKVASVSVQIVPVPLASVTVSPSVLTLTVGLSSPLTALLRTTKGDIVTDRAVTWSSTNAVVASVSTSGLVTALAPGIASVTASAEGLTAAASITVPPGPATRIVIGTTAAGSFEGRAFGTQPIVAVKDAWSNTLTGDNATLVQVSVSQGAALVGTTSRLVSGGVVAFSGLGLTGTVGSTYTLTFSAAGLSSSSQPILLAPFVFGAGTRVVGTDIIPGLYRSLNSVSASCYWERLRGFGGNSGDIIANDFGHGPSLVHIDASDKGFNSNGCAQWNQVVGAITASQTAPFGEGKYLVGKDVSAGLWRSATDNDGCFWERLSGLGGTGPETIANYINDGPAVVDIAPSDAGFGSSRCGTWTRFAGPVTLSPTSPFGRGTFVVGTDIAPGTWQASTPSTSCYWERLRGFSGRGSDVIGNFYGTTPAIVTIAPTDVGFTSSGCGVWIKMP